MLGDGVLRATTALVEVVDALLHLVDTSDHTDNVAVLGNFEVQFAYLLDCFDGVEEASAGKLCLPAEQRQKRLFIFTEANMNKPWFLASKFDKTIL